MAINVPVYKDANTPEQLDDLSALGDDDGSSAAAAKPGHIYMDAMGFGMGLSCLQVTFQVGKFVKVRRQHLVSVSEIVGRPAIWRRQRTSMTSSPRSAPSSWL